MSHSWSPSSETRVALPSTVEVVDDEDKSEGSYNATALPPLRALNPTVISSDTPIPPMSPPPHAFDPRMSAHMQQWGSKVVGGPPPGSIDTQPMEMETMSIGRYTTSATLETFPYDRAPNLQKLMKVYYRLYTVSGNAYPSKYPDHADDPSLSHIYAEHVPPPRYAEHFLLHVCAKEGIHTSRVKLYLRDPNGSDLRLALRDERVKILPPEDGLETLHFNIEMPGSADRDIVAEPVGFCTTGARAIGKCTGACCSGSAAGLVGSCRFIARLPEAVANSVQYCCVNFRSTWIACWTCGNSDHYTSTADRQCHCLLCPCCWCCNC